MKCHFTLLFYMLKTAHSSQCSLTSSSTLMAFNMRTHYHFNLLCLETGEC